MKAAIANQHRASVDKQRYLFAIELEPGLQQAIIQWRSTLFPAELGRPVAAKTLCLPLAYIGTVSAAALQQLQRRAAALRAPSFVLNFNDAGSWRQSGQIWLSGKPVARALLQLATQLQSLAARAGGPQIVRPYIPTLTILRQVPADFRLPAETFKASMRVQHFSLLALATGPHFQQQQLAQFPLLTDL